MALHGSLAAIFSSKILCLWNWKADNNGWSQSVGRCHANTPQQLNTRALAPTAPHKALVLSGEDKDSWIFGVGAGSYRGTHGAVSQMKAINGLCLVGWLKAKYTGLWGFWKPNFSALPSLRSWAQPFQRLQRMVHRKGQIFVFAKANFSA